MTEPTEKGGDRPPEGAGFQEPPKPILSALLLRDGTFDELWALVIKNRFEQEYEVRFTYFERASDLIRLVQERSFDIIQMYFGNVRWDVPGRDPFDLLAGLNHCKRIIVTQGLDLSKECERAGINFIGTPCTVEEYHAALEACLKAPPAGSPEEFTEPRPPSLQSPKTHRSDSLIYIVDDDKEVLELVSQIVGIAGQRVETYPESESALKAFFSANPKPDLIITNLNMPTMNGFDLIERVRGIAPQQRILMMSGASSYEVIEHARRRAVEFLAKPFAPMELLETVRSLLDDDSRNIPPQPGQQHPPVETVLSHAHTQAKSQAQGGNDMNHAKEFLKSIGSFVLGAVLLVALFTLVALFLHGSAWVSDKVLPILNLIMAISFFILLLVALPLSIFRKCRGWCGVAFVYWSYLCGLTLWMYSLLVTLELWGYVAAIIGLMFMGVGILPVALLACAFKGEWSVFFLMLLQFAILIGCRLFGFYLAHKAEHTTDEAAQGGIEFRIATTLQHAEKVVHEYGSVLASESRGDGPASYASRLPHSPDIIVQAMKLWLASEIRNHSLTQELRNEIATAASRLSYFIEDHEASRINQASRGFSPTERDSLNAEDFIGRAEAAGKAHEWATNAHIEGASLRSQLSDFITAVEQFDPNDSLFWQRVFTLAGLEYGKNFEAHENAK